MNARISWLENERKVKVKPVAVTEFQFDGFPEEVVKKLNDKKMKLMDFLLIKLDMVLEGTQLYVLAREDILGTSKTMVGTLENEPASWKEFPVSLKTFESVILI